MADFPKFGVTPNNGRALLSVANPNRDGTGTLETVIVAGANGTRVHRLGYKAVGATTAGMVRWFITDGVGTRMRLEITVTAAAAAATSVTSNATRSEATDPDLLPLFLESGETLKASTEKAESIIAFAESLDA